jgi:NAD(P)-dependent dehydrogenase (short-subunit alcohol dehydrogenase family)
MLKNNTLIIGGTRGIGSVIKKVFLDRGDCVYTASRNSSTDQRHLKLDLSNHVQLDPSLKLNYIIFAHRYRGQEWDDDFNITVKLIDLIINQFKDKFLNEASIVILGSNAGHFFLEEQSSSYHATRAALSGLVKYYAATLGHVSVRCNSVLPSTIIKPENEHFFTKTNEVRKMIEKITPLGRMGTAIDIANLVAFLCSDKSSFITGQSFFVDGGLSIIGQESIAREFALQKHPKK